MLISAQALEPHEIRAVSFGVVEAAGSEPPADWRSAAPGSLFDPVIFGPAADDECGCGYIKGAEHRGLVCPRCGVCPGDAGRARRTRFGHINLPLPLPHPVDVGTLCSVVAVPPLALREPLLHGDDLNILYSRLVESRGDPQAGFEALMALFFNEQLDQPIRRDDKPLRSLSWRLLDDPDRSVDDVPALLLAMGMRLAADGLSEPPFSVNSTSNCGPAFTPGRSAVRSRPATPGATRTRTGPCG